MAKSRIEWTGETWNPTTGCTKISPACEHCYAEVMAKKLEALNVKKYINGFQVTMHPDELKKPYHWKQPREIFVSSMSDLFHKDIPDEYILKVFKVINDCYWHMFQIITKREERLLEINEKIKWTQNIWMGVTVENSDYTHRIDFLRKTNAPVKFLCLEPLLGPIPSMNLENIDWVIVGGESGKNPRTIKKEWIYEIKEQCEKSNVKFFFKQWGGVDKKKSGRLLDGKIYNEKPEKLIMQEELELDF